MMEQLVQTQQQVMAAYLAARRAAHLRRRAAPVSRRPFFHDAIEVQPGVRAVAHHRFSAEREIVFHHHALGRDVSVEDPALLGLTLVPLTVTMEMLAEGARCWSRTRCWPDCETFAHRGG